MFRILLTVASAGVALGWSASPLSDRKLNQCALPSNSGDSVLFKHPSPLLKNSFLGFRSCQLFATESSSSESSEEASRVTKRKRRTRKRKVEAPETTKETGSIDSAESDSASAAAEDLSPEEDVAVPKTPRSRGDAVVAVAVQDVRTLVGGGPGSSSTPAVTPDTVSGSPMASSSSSSSSGSDVMGSSSFSRPTSDDSLRQLLADAKEFEDQVAVAEEGGDELSIPSTIRNAISTIVTIDFFVVCGFLVWFLAGIFASSVLQQDAIQIAFNSNFELLVQPALGILMVGSLAGAVFKDEQEEE